MQKIVFQLQIQIQIQIHEMYFSYVFQLLIFQLLYSIQHCNPPTSQTDRQTNTKQSMYYSASQSLI